MKTVYLDSHHISRIASGKSNLAASLLSQTICFSQSHVIEALPKDASNVDNSVRRLKIIMDSKAIGLVPWSNVIELEARANQKLTFNDLRCPITNILFYGLPTDSFGNRIEWMKKGRALIDEKLSAINDPNLRRSMRAKVYKHGKFTPYATQLFAEQQSVAIESVLRKLPEMLPLVDKGGMYDLLAGRVSSEVFAANFMKAVGNPIVLANLAAYPEFDSIMDISKFLWKETDRLTPSVSKLVNRLIEIQLASGPLPFDRLRAEIGKVIRAKTSRASLASALARLPVDPDALPNMPGLSLFVDSLIEHVFNKLDTYANAASARFAGEIRFERSIFADLTHLVYAPYVDVFGCDRGTRDMLRKAGHEIRTMATSDVELAKMLEEVIPS